MAGYRRLIWLFGGTMLLFGGGCSWFPLAEHPSPPPTTVEEPAKVIDLAFSGTES